MYVRAEEKQSHRGTCWNHDLADAEIMFRFMAQLFYVMYIMYIRPDCQFRAGQSWSAWISTDTNAVCLVLPMIVKPFGEVRLNGLMSSSKLSPEWCFRVIAETAIGRLMAERPTGNTPDIRSTPEILRPPVKIIASAVIDLSLLPLARGYLLERRTSSYRKTTCGRWLWIYGIHHQGVPESSWSCLGGFPLSARSSSAHSKQLRPRGSLAQRTWQTHT